jgi:hypothetical protein
VRSCLQIAALAVLLSTPVQAAEAILQGLDKITGRVSTFAAPIGKPVKFGTLQVTAQSCVKRPPEEEPEASAFLKIEELRADQSLPTVLFAGWMFASSPALNPLEHPVYDVWMLDCK